MTDKPPGLAAEGPSLVLVRVLPFVLFALPIYLQGPLGTASPYWIYAARTALGVALVAWMWPRVSEMRWAFSWEAVVVGIAVFVVWVGLDPYYPSLQAVPAALGIGNPPAIAEDSLWNPHRVFGEGSIAAWSFVLVRLLGSTLIVPPLEEVFYRSFLYRYFVRTDFLSMPLSQFRWVAFTVVCLVFGLAHHQWLAGILCALAYQALVIRKGRLGDAMTAHAITNALLGLWIIGRDAWQFW